MNQQFKIACIQSNAGPDILPNIQDVDRLIRSARAAGAEFVTTSENFTCIEFGPERSLAKAVAESEHPAIPHFTALAKELGCWILMGSLTIKLSPARSTTAPISSIPTGASSRDTTSCISLTCSSRQARPTGIRRPSSPATARCWRHSPGAPSA